MARASRPQLIQQVFEARYHGGYRYLDRCGDAMIILEDLLLQTTGKIWLPKEMVPTRARLICPDLDFIVLFSAERMIAEQKPVGQECAFPEIAAEVFATIWAKFNIRALSRLGSRHMYLIATDSLAEAEELSVRRAPFTDFPASAPDGMRPLRAEAVTAFATPDHSQGIKFEMTPAFKVGADIEVDERLKVPPRLLPSGQREALLEQLRRSRKRMDEPDAGLLLDVDYYWLNPEGEPKVRDFMKKADEEIDKSMRAFSSFRRR